MRVLLQDSVGGIALGALYAVIAVGFSLIFAVTKVVNASYGAVAILGTFLYISVTSSLAGPFGIVFGLLAATLATAAFSSLSSIAIFDRMLAHGRSFFGLFTAGYGLMVVVDNVLTLHYGSGVALLGVGLFRGPHVDGISISYDTMLAVGSSIVMLVGIWYLFFRSRLGMKLRAMADGEDLLAMVGLPTRRYRWTAFAIGGAIVTAPSILLAYVQGVSTSEGFDILTVALAATIVGGVGSIVGSALAGLLLGFVEQVSSWKLPGTWYEAVAFGLFLVLIMVRPAGFTSRGWHRHA